MNKRKMPWILVIMTTILLTVTACSSDSSDEPQPVTPTAVADARVQVMVVFAPGQLGDKGYADRLLMGASTMDYGKTKTDSTDVEFISQKTIGGTHQALKKWGADNVNPFSGKPYSRRLLVLSEPYMADWLDDVKSSLQPTDEVLVMKTSESHVEQIAAKYSLGNRIHGLNIDINPYIHQYCDYVRYYVENNPTPGFYGNKPLVKLYRRYQYGLQYSYSDSIEAVIRHDLGNLVELQVTSLSKSAEEDAVLEGNDMTYIQLTYDIALAEELYSKENGYTFIITDLGTCNAGFDYHLYSRKTNGFEVLMIDANVEIGYRLAICRNVDPIIAEWIRSWMQKEAGSMPRFNMYDSTNVSENLPKANREA